MSDFVVIQKYDNAQMAHLDLAKLTDEGIDAFLQDENMVTNYSLTPNVFGYIKLLVNTADAESARKVLAADESGSLGQLDSE